MTHRVILALLALLMALAGCSRDPEKVKWKYVENGDKYFAQGKHKQASIMYRNALKRDAKFGEAYAKLGDVELRRGEIRQAVNAYRRAVELLPDSDEPAGKLADIFLAGYALQQSKDQRLLDEVKDLSDTLLNKDPKSYHGLRLKGFLAYAAGSLKDAIVSFREADAVRPKRPELRFALCQVLTRDGQWDEAEKLGRQLLEDSPEYTPTFDFLYLEYMRRERHTDAETVMKKKVEHHPKNARFRAQLAALYHVTKRPAESEKVLQELLAKESELPNARMEVGDFYARVREFPKAIAIYEEGARKADADRTNYRLKAAMIRVAEGRTGDALQRVEEALRDDPNNNDAISMRASLQLQSGDREKTQTAIADLQSLLGRTPNNPVVRYNLARAYQSRSELDASRVQYMEAIKLRPDFIAAHVGLGQIHLGKREYGKALESAENALRLDANNVFAKVIKSNALLNTGNLRQARMDLSTYLKATPDSPDLQVQMALVDFYEGRFTEAETAFRALRERYPGDLRLIYAIAEVFMRTQKPAEALRFLTDEQKKSPDRVELNKALGNVAMRTGALDAAEREYRKLITIEPKNVELYLRLGETLRRKGQTQASIDVLRKGQQLEPNNPQANLQLALTLDSAGLKRESLPLYENVVKNQPDNAIALNNLAYMLAEDGRDLDQALTYAQRARQQLPNNPDVADTLGWIYIRKNLSDNAVVIFRELTQKHRGNPVYHYHLGMALMQKGDRAGARRSLQTALSLQPAKDDELKIRELLSQLS